MNRRLLILMIVALAFPSFAFAQNLPADPPVSDADIKALANKLRALSLAQNPQVQKQIEEWLRNGGQLPNNLPPFPPIDREPPMMPQNRRPAPRVQRDAQPRDFDPEMLPPINREPPLLPPNRRPPRDNEPGEIPPINREPPQLPRIPRDAQPRDINPGQMPPFPNAFDPFNNPLQNRKFDGFEDKNLIGGKNTDINGFVKFWEKNFGPLDQTPELKNALLDLMKNEEGEDFGKGFFDDLDGKGAAGDEFKGFGDWFDGNFGGGDWKLPDLGLKDWFPKNKPGIARQGDGGGWGGFKLGDWSIGSGGGGGAGTWLPVILFIAILVVALVAWRFWPGGESKERGISLAVQRLGAWPVDPRTIANRDDLVRAFEYLSVLLCGSAAKVWNHHTIAAALRAKLPESESYADELSHLYELAKYTSVGEPLPATALADARRCLCQLAGVAPA